MSSNEMTQMPSVETDRHTRPNNSETQENYFSQCNTSVLELQPHQLTSLDLWRSQKIKEMSEVTLITGQVSAL